MLPVTEEFKHTAEQSLTGAKVMLYYDSGGNYRDLDVTEECVGAIKVRYALSGESGYTASITPLVTVTLLQSDNLDGILENLVSTGDLNIRIDVYNLIGNHDEKVKLFDGVLMKREERKLDVFGEVVSLVFCHPLVKRRIAAVVPDPYGIEGYWEGAPTLRRRDVIRALETLSTVAEYAPVKFEYHHGTAEGVDFFDVPDNLALPIALADVQETHTPVSRGKNKGKANAAKFKTLDSADEELVKVRGLAWHDTDNILIVGIDEIQIDYDTGEVKHVPKIAYYDFNEGALNDGGPAGFLRMETDVHKLFYIGDVKRSCPDGYRILDLAYSGGVISGVLETATDDPGDGVQYSFNQRRRFYPIESATQGEKYSRCFTFNFTWANRKQDNPFGAAQQRFRKYHKGIRIYSKFTAWTSPADIEEPDGNRGCHVAEMIGHGTPATDRKIGIPILFNYLVGKYLWRELGPGPITEIWFDYRAHRKEISHIGEPDIPPRTRADYLQKGSHIAILYGLRPISVGGETAVTGSYEYLGKIDDVTTISEPIGRYKVKLATPHPRFFGATQPGEGPSVWKHYVFIYHDDDIPDPTLLIPEYTELKLNYDNKMLFTSETEVPVMVEKKNELHPMLNYFFNPYGNYRVINAQESFKSDPGLFAFTASPPIEGFMTTRDYKVWQPGFAGGRSGVVKRTTPPDGTWTSDYPLPFWVDYQFISEAAQFLPARGLYVCNNDINELNNAIKPDAGRPSPHAAPYDSVVVYNDAGILRPAKVEGGGYLTVKGNIYLWENPANEDVYFFCNDFDKGRCPTTSHTAIEWYVNCKIYKWNEAKKTAHLIFQDRAGEPYTATYYNKLGKEYITSDPAQQVNPPRLFTGNGVLTIDRRIMVNVMLCPCKTIRRSRENTGVKVVGAAHPEYRVDWGLAGLKSSISGAHAILILQGDVSERFEDGDNIELRWDNKAGPHVTYRIINVETILRDLKTGKNKIVSRKFAYGGTWTLLTIESIHLMDGKTPQESVIDQCVRKGGLEQAGVVKYYYIYKVGKSWEYATLHTIETFSVGEASAVEFRESETPRSVLWSNSQSTRLPGEQYKTLDADYIPGEVLTPGRTDEYEGLPYATLSKLRYDYFRWLMFINDRGGVEKYRYNMLTVKDSKMRLRAKLVFTDTEIAEPDEATCLIKPNCGDDFNECRVFFNRKYEGVEVCFDYSYFPPEHYTTGMGTWGADRNYAVLNSNDDALIRFDINLMDLAGCVSSRFITQKGIVGKPVVCGSRLVMLTKPDNILATVNLAPLYEHPGNHAPYNTTWTGFIENYRVGNKRLWDTIGQAAKALNSYAIPNNVRYRNNDNKNCVTLYPRYYRGDNAPVLLDPVKVRRVKNVDYTQVVCSYKHGKAIMEYSGGEFKYEGTRAAVAENKYEFSADIVANYGHAMALVKSTFDWLIYKREYTVDLGYLASWLQILDVVMFEYKGAVETAFVTGANHTVKGDGNGLTTLQVIGYTNSVGEPFLPGGKSRGEPISGGVAE